MLSSINLRFSDELRREGLALIEFAPVLSSSLIMQAYNFNGDSSLAGAIAGPDKGNYTADWANTPEPTSLLLMGTIVGLTGYIVRRRKLSRP